MKQRCLKCKQEKELDRFTKGWKTCKFCTWIKKHQFEYPDSWQNDIAQNTLELVSDGKVKYLNELVPVANKPIVDIISLIKDDLKIHNVGNRKLLVLKPCEICGTQFEVHIGDYYNNKFCSRECYSKYRHIYCVGEKASVYTKTQQECTYCHKPMLLPKNKLLTTNKEGLNHHFCSKDCYYKFRKEYYVGDKLYNTGITLSDEARKRISQNVTRLYSNGTLSRQTIPQKLVNQMLTELNINYANEQNYKYYAVDNYLIDYDLLIEVMGDYFHSNPTIYSKESLNKMQNKDVVRDKRKRTYILKYYNKNILYLWETDIKNEYEKCKNLIKLYVQNNGHMIDYQSYNFNDDLSLKNKIINPYFIENP